MADTVQISRQALKRMPYYLQQLKQLQREGAQSVAATTVAARLDLNEVQVRKDFAAVCAAGGRPKAGFPIAELVAGIERLLGYDDVKAAILVGAGSLGRALLAYGTFRDYGIDIAAAFDIDPAVAGRQVSGKPVYPMEALEGVCRTLAPRIGIITCPAAAAQAVCDRLVACGVLAIWNFAPTHLNAPENILVQSENMAASLAVLSKHLQDKLAGEAQENC